MAYPGSSGSAESNKIKLLRVVIFFSVVLCIGLILIVPFAYESTTMWYKIGVHRTMLRIGKMAGLTAAFLLYIQVLLGIRGPVLKKIFGVANLMRYHRINGKLITFLALLHVSLVLIPEGIDNLPVGWKYWPELVGAVLFLFVFLQTLFAVVRQRLQLNYGRWRSVHKVLGFLVLAVIPIHVLWVSDSFAAGVPRIGFVLFFVLFISLIFLEKKLDLQ